MTVSQSRFRQTWTALVAVAVLLSSVTASVPVSGQSSGAVSAPAVAYTETGGGSIHLVDSDGTTVDTGVSAKILGPVADVDSDGPLEVAPVDSSGAIQLVPAVSDATAETLTSSGASKADPAARTISVGDLDDDGNGSVLFSNEDDNQQTGALARVENDRSGWTVTRIDSEKQTKGVLAYGDFTDDGTDEVVFRGSSEQIRWYNPNTDSYGDTGTNKYGTNNGVDLGPLADYDDDGVNRVSAVGGSNTPALVNDSGDPFDKPDSNYQQASKSSVAAVDVTGDDSLEILHQNSSAGTVYYMTVDGASREWRPGRSSVSPSDVQGLSGTATASRIGATANSRPEVVGGGLGDWTNNDSETVSVDVSSAFSDPDGDSLSYSASGLPAGLSIDTDTGKISGTIDGAAPKTARTVFRLRPTTATRARPATASSGPSTTRTPRTMALRARRTELATPTVAASRTRRRELVTPTVTERRTTRTPTPPVTILTVTERRIYKTLTTTVTASRTRRRELATLTATERRTTGTRTQTVTGFQTRRRERATPTATGHPITRTQTRTVTGSRTRRRVTTLRRRSLDSQPRTRLASASQ